MMNEHYPTLVQMAPRNKTYPVTWMDGWNIFRGPKIGQKSPDGYVVVVSNEAQQLLSTLLDKAFTQSDKKFCVIVFDGYRHGNTTGVTSTLAQECREKFTTIADSITVTNYYDGSQYDSDGRVVGDVDGELSKNFGASGQSIYVIDNHRVIVRKSCGLMKEQLFDRLQSQS